MLKSQKVLEEPTMPNSKLFDEVTSRISELIAASPARDMEKNARALLTSALARLDLVTREEFDVQAALLARSQEKLAALDARVAGLEAAANKPAA